MAVAVVWAFSTMRVSIAFSLYLRVATCVILEQQGFETLTNALSTPKPKPETFTSPYNLLALLQRQVKDEQGTIATALLLVVIITKFKP